MTYEDAINHLKAIRIRYRNRGDLRQAHALTTAIEALKRKKVKNATT